MANIFKSKFTGEQIDEILQKAQDAETPIEVQANPQGEPSAELDKLKVGDTIYQTPRPIDVVANPTSVGEEDLTKLRVGSTVYNIPQPQTPTTVVANPSGSGSTELNKLQVGNTIYNIPQPETPITVQANPQGDATKQLDKLRVGDTIYETPRPTDVVANPAGVGTTDLTKLRVGSTVYNIPKSEAPTTVIANPVGGGNVDLHSIQVGDVKYNIVEPETVAANPLQQATEILSKLQVGSTVYTIIPAGAPIEISTEAAMDAVLGGAQIGAVFKYVGATTSKYENGSLYVVEEEVKSYSLTITNAGNSSHEFMFYGVDTDIYDDLQQLDYSETVTVNNVKNFVYCSCDYIFKRDNVVLNNCTIEWISNGECKLYPTGDNASATLEVYD